jgi:hypothetical protein
MSCPSADTQSIGALLRQPDHVGIKINADDRSILSNEASEFRRQRSRATANIEDVRFMADFETLNRQPSNSLDCGRLCCPLQI